MVRLFNDGFTNNSISHSGVLVDCVINCFLGVCVVIIKKTYGEDDYIIIKLTNIEHSDGNTLLIGELIEAVDHDFKRYKEIVLHADESIEVLEP